MANYRAVTNGNWSSLATWEDNTGGSFVASTVLPDVNDDVYSNNFTVTIDISTTVASLRNTAVTGVTAGGKFFINNGVTFNATGIGLVNNAMSTTLLECNLNSPNSATITATNMSGSGGGPNTLNGVVVLTGTGTLTVNSNWAVNNTLICISDNGVLNLNGSGGHTSTFSTQQGIRITATNAILNWVGNLTFNGSSTWAYISNGSTSIVSTVNMTGIIKGSNSSSAPGISTNGIFNLVGIAEPDVNSVSGVAISGGAGSVINVNGIVRLNNAGVLAVSTTGLLTVSGQIVCVNERFPISATRLRLANSTTTQITFQTDVVGVNKTLYEPGTALGNPATTDVRDGVTYASGALTGTLKVPPSTAVSVGVPVDNTVGSAVVTVSDLGALLASYNV
jgi:hypothetical protein